jgi:hypothetical protein
MSRIADALSHLPLIAVEAIRDRLEAKIAAGTFDVADIIAARAARRELAAR